MTHSIALCVACLLLLSICDSFMQYRPARTAVSIKMSNLEILGRNVEITEALKDKCNAKIGSVISKLGAVPISSQVVLRVEKNANEKSDIVEVTIKIKGGVVVRCEERGQDMYAGIDSVSAKIAEKLKQLKGKGKGSAICSTGSFQSAEKPTDPDIEKLEKKYKESLGDDPAQWTENFSKQVLVKTKSFPMPAISVEEALVYLDLIDHPFYVFRNKDTNEINVVYKRIGSKGSGHIQPSEGM